ncbi:MAG: aminotransferase class V-fold PLP-dependent enzyme [Myxococcota bacterium]
MIYLDHAATSLPRAPEALLAALDAANWASPGRGMHSAQSASRVAVQRARDDVRRLVGFGTVVFTAGCTAALNMALHGLRPRPRVVAVDPMIHNAVRRPLARLGARVWKLPSDLAGRVDPRAAERAWQAETELVVLTHGSNVTGLLQPVAELAEVAHRKSARILVDAAQTAGLLCPLDVGEADLVAFSAHKGLRALPGVGALVVRDGVELDPLLSGGTGGEAVAVDMPAALPERLEAGTPNLPGIAAMGAAAALTTTREPWPWRERARALREAVRAAGLTPLGEGELPVVSCRVGHLTPTMAEEILDRVFGIVVRAGLHCAPAAHEHLGSGREGAVRFSVGPSTSDDDLAMLTQALRQLEGMEGGNS